MVPSKNITGKALADALGTLLDHPSVIDACKGVAKKFEAENGVAMTCDVLEEYARTGRAPEKKKE